MLRLLSGHTHEVLTGICLCHRAAAPRARRVHARADGPEDEAEIAWYVSTGEPYDKAGGYAVQGLASRFIEGIDGLVFQRRRAAYLQCLRALKGAGL